MCVYIHTYIHTYIHAHKHIRYPGGESYLDLLTRVDPVVKEIRQLESEGKHVLVVAHQATLRCVLAKLTGISEQDTESIPSIQMPLHSLVKVRVCVRVCVCVCSHVFVYTFTYTCTWYFRARY